MSHSRVWEDVKRADEKDTKKSQAQQTAKAMKNVSDNIEVTTLGDISELAALKSQMEKEEKAKK